jgi:hypothetical protein
MPRNSAAILAIQAFLKTGPWITLLLVLMLNIEFNCNWRGYTQTLAFTPLPYGPSTLDVVATWLLTFLFRKPKDDDPEVDYTPSFHRVIEFLRGNSHLVETRQLLQFLATFQKSRLERYVLPSWFELALVPLFKEEFIPVDPSEVDKRIRRDNEVNHPNFWKNFLQALSLQYVPFWLNTSEYIMKFTLYELLQNLAENTPDVPEIRVMIQHFLEDKSLDFFKFFQADLLIFLAHHHFLTQEFIRQTMFNRLRRDNYYSSSSFLWTWLRVSSLDNPIILSFLTVEFRSFHVFATKSNQDFQDFVRFFTSPQHFFKKLTEKPEILTNSEILVKEMEKFFNLFFWNVTIFFPTLDQYQFIHTLMELPQHWRNLIVQLYRFDANVHQTHHILIFVRNVLTFRNVRFDKNLFDTCSFYMKEVVAKSSPQLKLNFLGWLLQLEDMSILVHFPLPAELVPFVQQTFPDIPTKRALFWSFFLTDCVKKYQGPERNLTVDMGTVCEQMGLQTTPQELSLRNHPDSLKTVHDVYSLFGVVELDLKFGNFAIIFRFSKFGYCQTQLNLELLNLFRLLVISLKTALNEHMQPPPMPHIPTRLKDLVEKITQNREFMKQLTDGDRKFLKSLFHSYLPNLILTDELLRLLRELSFLFPSDVKQAMFEECKPLKILDNEIRRLAEEQADASSGRKRSRDLSDQSSYEAQCSLCAKFRPLSEIGVDSSGDTMCRPCSQARGIVICTLLDKIPFASLKKN